MIQPRVSHSSAFAVAWIVATAVGTFPLILPQLFDFPVIQVLSLNDYGAAVEAAGVAVWLGICQYIVFRAWLRRSSLTATLWIPATVVGVIVAAGFTGVWEVTVPRTLISVSAIQASLPAGFPLIEVIAGLFLVPLACFVGMSQGLVLSKVFRRSAVGPWLFANILAAVPVGVVQGVQFHLMAGLVDGKYTLDESTLAVSTAVFVAGTLLSGVLYAAVTARALLVVARPGAERRIP